MQRASTVFFAGLIFLGTLALFVVLAGVASQLDVQRLLEDQGRQAVQRIDSIIYEVKGDVEAVTPLVGAPCDDRTQEELAEVAYRSVYAREFGLIQGNRLYCTNFGPADVPITGGYGIPDPSGRFSLQTLFTVVQAQQSLLVQQQRSEGNWANGLIAPALFVNRLADLPAARNGYFFVNFSDGEPIFATERPPSQPAFDPTFAVRVQSRQNPIVVGVTADTAWRVGQFLAVLPAWLALGAGVGALMTILFLRSQQRRFSMEREMEIAIRRQEFVPFYQPVIELATGRCVGAEALIRWKHPDRGMVPPDVFITLAEESGLILPITDWLMRQTQADLDGVFQRYPGFHVAINLVAEHFKDQELADKVAAAYGGPAAAAERVILEATERRVMEDPEGRILGILDDLRAKGIQTAIDDFGTGHSGLAMLTRYRMTMLKIDKVFVDALGTDAVNRPILDNIIELGHNLGMGLIAEGIETEEQYVYLRNHGVVLGQGYYFCRPLPLAEFEVWLDTNRATVDSPPAPGASQGGH